jgi:hypothetical protein
MRWATSSLMTFRWYSGADINLRMSGYRDGWRHCWSECG